jgi:hypothetical protein
MVINRPYTQCDPLPIPIATGTMLVYHANESVTYTSTVYGATETVDTRYAGSTTIDVRNTAKRDLKGKFGDFQTYTYDSGQNGQRTNLDWYARDTVGLHLAPDTTEQIVIQSNQNRLRNALRELLPARCGQYLLPKQHKGSAHRETQEKNTWATFRATPLIR